MRYLVLLLTLLFSGCTWVFAPDTQTAEVKAHWMEENETAPFEGLLINSDTYERMRVKLLECQQ